MSPDLNKQTQQTPQKLKIRLAKLANALKKNIKRRKKVSNKDSKN